MSLPKSLDYNDLKKRGAASTPSFARYRSNNSVVSGGDVIRIEIPTGGQGQILLPNSSYLEGKINLSFTKAVGATTGNAKIDTSIYSIIRSIRVIHGTNQVEFTSSDYSHVLTSQIIGRVIGIC